MAPFHSALERHLGIYHHLIFPIDTVAVRPATRRRSAWHIIELDPHRDALRQADPAEGRIDGGQQLAAGAPILILNAVSDALDVARKHTRVPDKFHGRVFTDRGS